MGFHNQTVNQIIILLKKLNKNINTRTIMSLTNHLPQASSSISKDILNPQYLKTKQRLCPSFQLPCARREKPVRLTVEPLTENTEPLLYSCTICWQLERWHAALSAPAPTLQGVGQCSRFYKTFKNVNMATQNSHKHRKYVNSWTYMSERGLEMAFLYRWEHMTCALQVHHSTTSVENRLHEQAGGCG